MSGFFRSRWVEAPEHVRELEPAALPAGFRAGAVAAGLKPEGLDVGVLFSDEPGTVSAARFTTNSRVGAPVIVSKESALDRLRAVVANAGGSNTGDGQRGVDTARATQEAAAEKLGIEPEQVGVASTGVIAAELPRDRVTAGTRAAIDALTGSAEGLAQAIVTTDRWPKRACLEVTLRGGTVRLAAQAKGAGMISPRYATMFCFVETDAALAAETVELLTGVCVKRSFDRISVDGQLSTSDTVFVLANGASGVNVESESADELLLGEAIDALMRQLAMEIVADGEGSKRIGRVIVRGDSADVERVARSVANSPLVKTALHGADPNYGRILQAAGQVLAPPFLVDLEIEGRRVVTAGDGHELDAGELRALEQAVEGTEVEYALTIPGEGGETEVYFSDLSHEYVTINAEYTT
ncbi:MAG: glutamate N-acetyltransferase / amino-acid N-acetyltransferase [Thermoleophilaceae bacterium]|nr:glutamate N-acetyltransferase / amino-acid N-acetyltransferase [Thermoleophilaceae bacterium]